MSPATSPVSPGPVCAKLAVVLLCCTSLIRPSLGQTDKVGLYTPPTGVFELEVSGPQQWGWLIEPREDAALIPLAGDWNGDGIDTIGLYDRDSSEFHLKNYPGGYWDPATSTVDDRTYFADHFFAFGNPDTAWLPIVGDWDGDGADTIGLYSTATSEFHLKNSLESGDSDVRFQFGDHASGWIPLAGDFNGDQIDTVGLYNPFLSEFHLVNADRSGNAEILFRFGPQYLGWQPLVGDWDKDGVDTVGLYDPEQSQFHLTNSFRGGDADVLFHFGAANCGWTPLAGDWDGDGIDSLGLHNARRITLEDKYDPVRSEFHLKNSFSGGNADIRAGFGWHNDYVAISGDWDGDGYDGIGLFDPVTATFHLSNGLLSVDERFQFGSPRSGWMPIAGDWDGDGKDSIGLYDPVHSAFHLKNSLSGGYADIVIDFGIPASEWWPIAGDWDGDGMDTIGLYWRERSEFHLKNSHDGYFADVVFQFGEVLQGFEEGPILNWPGDFPVVGDWDNDGVETVGLYDPEFSIFFLLNEHRSGPLVSADALFPFGWSGASYWAGDVETGGWPIAGRW